MEATITLSTRPQTLTLPAGALAQACQRVNRWHALHDEEVVAAMLVTKMANRPAASALLAACAVVAPMFVSELREWFAVLVEGVERTLREATTSREAECSYQGAIGMVSGFGNCESTEYLVGLELANLLGVAARSDELDANEDDDTRENAAIGLVRTVREHAVDPDAAILTFLESLAAFERAARAV